MGAHPVGGDFGQGNVSGHAILILSDKLTIRLEQDSNPVKSFLRSQRAQDTKR
jgi:hypothetical protein